MSILATTADQRGDPLIAAFEEEQKNAVFSALSEYLHQNMFCDVSLVVGHQVLRAHKMVLASSSKFFSNAFNHYPSLTSIDIERELAPHGITVTFDDVRLIVGVLYCVGTIDISPQRVEDLLLIAQIMGIPSLIRLLKRIKDSLLNDESHTVRASLSPLKKTLVYVQLPPSAVSSRQQVETRSLTFEQHSTTSFFHTRKILQPEVPPTSAIEDEITPPSRSGSRATLASLSSFPFNPISSPALREANEATNNPQILDNLPESFLNQLTNLHSNQIDDLESALLPHLPNETTTAKDAPLNSTTANTSLQFKKSKPQSSPADLNDLVVVDDSFNTTVDDNVGLRPSLDIAKQELLPLIPSCSKSNNDELPKSCSTPKRPSLNLTLTNENDDFTIDSPPPYETMNMEQLNELLPDDTLEPPSAAVDPPNPEPDPVIVPAASKEVATPAEETNQNSSNDLIIDEDALVEQEEAPVENNEDTTSTEFKIPLNASEASEGKSITFNLPGSSKSLTLNFSADALNKMLAKHEKINKQVSVEEVTSSTNSVRKKGAFKCQLCSKSFPSKRMLSKHEKYHVAKNTSCKQCGQVFTKNWKLEQHMAKDHANGQSLECKDCGKQFQWHRNLLAHINLNHQREIRYRCKNCPLTFLKKKAFIYHHREKHKEAVEPWCNLCLEVFDGNKQRDDHLCSKIGKNCYLA